MRAAWGAALAAMLLAACSDSGGGCPQDGYCPATAPVCNAEADECVACTTYEGCEHFDDLPICRDGECVGCTPGIENPDYCPGFVCVGGASCRQCLAGSECLSGLCWEDLRCLGAYEVLYVEAGASTDSFCTQTEPCGEIQRAIDVAEGYARYVHIGAGLYPEAVVIDAASSADVRDGFVVFGEPGAVVAPAVDGAPAFTVEGTGVLFSNLELVGASGAGGHGLSCANATIGIRGSQIRDSGADGVFAVDCDLKIEKTSLVRNGGHAIDLDGGILAVTDSLLAENLGLGIRLPACDLADVSRTVIRGNRDGGLLASCHFVGRNVLVARNGSASSTIGGAELGAPYSALDFSTIADNRASASAAATGVSCTVDMTYVTDSIVADNAADAPQIFACSVRSSLVTPGPAPRPGANFTGDPAFVAPADGNYDIGPDSEAIGRATDIVADDIHGDARGPDALDVGADEYHP